MGTAERAMLGWMCGRYDLDPRTVRSMAYNEAVAMETTKAGRTSSLPDPPREGLWIAKPRKPFRSLQVLTGVAFLCQIPTFLNIVGNATGNVALFRALFFVLCLFVVGVAFGPFVADWLAQLKRGMSRVLVDGGFGAQFPAEVTTVVEGKRIACDRGVVWFADDLFGFSGEASSFVLAARDLAPQWPPIRRRPGIRGVPNDAIVLLGTPKIAYILIRPLLGYSRNYRHRLKQFFRRDVRTEGERLRAFVKNEDRNEAERFWPPLKRYEASQSNPAGSRP